MKTERIINSIVSFGAVPVIVGAYFKLEHLPYAGLLLGVGLVTEAVIFAIYGVMYALGKFKDAETATSSGHQIGDTGDLSKNISSLDTTMKKIYNLR